MTKSNSTETVDHPFPHVFTKAVKQAKDLPSAFVETEPDTEIDLPHIMWNPYWRPALEKFVEQTASMSPFLELNYAKPQPENLPKGADADDILLPYLGNPETATMHFEFKEIKDQGLRLEMANFVRAFYEYEIDQPDEGVIVTKSMLGPEGGYGMKHLFALLRAGLVDLTGQRLAAHVIETNSAGFVERFPPHSDMWITSLLFNVFNVQTPGQGVSTMVQTEKAWDVIANSGIPDHGLAQMKRVLEDSGACDFYMQFNGWMYNEHAWSDKLGDELLAISQTWEMKPGQGYLVNDRKWLHGRLELDWPENVSVQDRCNRLYRLGYNNRRLQEQAEARQTNWDMVGYYANDCIGGALIEGQVKAQED